MPWGGQFAAQAQIARTSLPWIWSLAFIPLTQSVFWGSMAYTLIGGTAVGTVLILVFLPALYAIWFRVKPLPAENLDSAEQPTGDETPLSASPSVATWAVLQHATE